MIPFVIEGVAQVFACKVCGAIFRDRKGLHRITKMVESESDWKGITCSGCRGEKSQEKAQPAMAA